ncbi:MAG: signal peptidase I [Gammaproteobacteria bacterium]|nr:signal peptidase I [Gammaproteobacteria bacterium]
MVIAVFVSGLISLYDVCICKRKRTAIIRRVTIQLSLSADKESTKTDNSPSLLVKLGEPTEVGYAKSFFPVLLVVLVLRSFIVEPFQIPSASMVPSLEIGDFILVNKYTYGIRLPVIRNKVVSINNPERGDVMVFFPPHQKRYFIKRVVGLPGDEIHYVNNILYINGQKMPQTLVASLPPNQPVSLLMQEDLTGIEHLIKKDIKPGPLSHNFTTVVPEGHYFMMGDNRDNSSDSRDWGAVPEKNIVGKAFAIWMHWDQFFSLPSFSRAGSIK